MLHNMIDFILWVDYKMLTHLNYKINKPHFIKYFWDNYTRGTWHHFSPPKMMWWKLFRIDEVCDPVIEELGLEGMNILPRFSYQFANTRLPEHIDIDKIIGINFNLMGEYVPVIHMKGIPYPYECILVNVGKIPHSIEPVPHDRLILKFAIREPWDKIYDALKGKNWID